MASSQKSKTFPYPQQPSFVTYRVKSAIDSLLKIGIPAEHILDIYSDAQWLAQQSKYPENPYQYMRTAHGLSKKDRSIPYFHFEKIYTEAISVFRRISVLSFLAEFDAYFHHESNDSGLDNGMLYETFWYDALHNNSCHHNIFINAPAHFIDKCLSDPNLMGVDIEFCFSDARRAMICQFNPVSPIVSWSSIDDLILQEHPTKIMIWGNNLSSKKLQAVLQACQKLLCKTGPATIYLTLPTSLFDSKRKNDHFCNYLISNFKIVQAIIIESGIAKTKPAKRSLLVLQPSDYPNDSISLTKATPIHSTGTKSNEKVITALELQPNITIPYSSFLATHKTLSALYQEHLKLLRNPPMRAHPRQYSFTIEITIWFSVSPCGDKLRGKYHFYAYPTADQLRKNTLARGRPVRSNISGRVVATEDEIIAYAEQLPFLHADLGQDIRSEVLKHFGNSPISLKTFWFLYFPSFEENVKYNHTLCGKLFCGVGSCNSPICSLMVGSCTAEEIKRAVNAFLADNPFPTKGAKKLTDELWNQINLLFATAIIKGLVSSNPVQSIIQERDRKRDDMQATRDAMVINSLSRSQNSLLYDDLPADSSLSGEHLGYLLCSLGFTTGIVCALNMEDLIHTAKNSLLSLKITKHIVGNKKKAECLENFNQHTLFPIPRKFIPLFLSWEKSKTGFLTGRGISPKEMGEYPLLHSKDVLCRLTPRTLNKYCRGKVSYIHRPDMVIKIPINRTTRQETDLNKYGASILKSNFDYFVTHYTTMSQDEIAYCRRVKAVTVMGNNYCDYAHPGIQLGMRINLDRGLAILDSTLNHPTPVQNQFTCGSSNYRHINSTPCNEGTELVIDIDLPCCEDGTALDLQFLAELGATIYIDSFEE